jgi:predicted type IV restriction endonuclease
VSEIESSNTTETPSSSSKPSIPKWEQTARDRISTALKKIGKSIEALKARDAVEADTRLLVTDVLCDMLGFDKYEDLTAEYQVKGEFADYGVRVDKQLVAFVEIKRITQKLNATHLRQVESYALKNGVTWAILTNAQVWQVYNIQSSSGEQAETTLVFEVDLLDTNVKPREKVPSLLAISREGFSKGLIDDAWRQRFVSSPKALKPVILSKSVIEEIRKELWRQQRTKVDAEQIRQSIESMLP